MRTIVVATLEDAIAALRQGGPVRLCSAPFASASLGAAGFLAIITAARAAVPGVEAEAVLDCGDAPGHALGALRLGLKAVSLSAPPETLAKLADIAAQSGARIYQSSSSGPLRAIFPPN